MLAMLAFGLDKSKPNWSLLKTGDYSGILSMAIGFSTLVIMMEKGRKENWFESNDILTLAFISSCSILLFIVIELRKKLDIVHDLTQNKKQPGLLRTILRHKLSRIAAASFVVLLIITSLSLYFLRPDGNMSNDSLFKIYYQPDAALLIRGTNSQNAALIQAFQMYENKEYTNALSLFSQVLETDLENIPVQFYSGISNIELGQYQDALHPFTYIMEHKQNLYVERAEWFTALCYLKLNENENAIDLFRKISLSGSSHKDKAHEILKSIQD